MESPAGPRTQRAGRRKWPDVPAQEWSWKLRRTLERRTEPHLSPPLDLTPRDRCQVRVNDGERTGTFITPFTEKKRNIHTQQRKVGLEACVTPEVGFVGVWIQGGPPLSNARRSEGLGELGCPRNCVEWKGFDLEDLARTDPTPSRGSRGYRPFCTAARTNVDFKKLDSFLRIMWIFTTLSHLCLEARQAVPPGCRRERPRW